VLVERADGLGGLLAEADFADDAGAAVATELDHLFIVAVLGERDLEDAADLVGGTVAGNDAVPEQADGGEAGAVGLGPVFELDAGFDGAVVAAADDLAHAGGVAAATDVFEEQGGIEIGEVGAADAHAEQAAAQGVAGDGAFGEIERKRQGGENCRERRRAGVGGDGTFFGCLKKCGHGSLSLRCLSEA
jgi:hypothetical protein